MTEEIDRLNATITKLETAHGQNMREIDRLNAELAAERERADKAKATEHKQWVRALMRVLPEERAALFREICLARAALGGGDEP